jgi:hypothetical protein
MAETITQIDPMPVYFTFSRIRPQFSCGRFVHDTLHAIQSGALAVADLPTIAVLFDGANYFSLNNRRLFVFKELRRLGLVATVPARVKPVPQTKRMKEKYSVEKCALQARCHQRQDAQDDNGSGDDGAGIEVERGSLRTSSDATAPAAAATADVGPASPNDGGAQQQPKPKPAGPPLSKKEKQLLANTLVAGGAVSDDDSDDAFLTKKERTRKKKKGK